MTAKPKRVLRLPMVEDKTGCSKPTIYRKIKEGTFPRPIKICGGHASGWLEEEIDAYIDAQIEARDAGERKNETPPEWRDRRRFKPTGPWRGRSMSQGYKSLRSNGQAVTLWQRHPDSVPLDPQVWWWRDMSKVISMMPNTTKPIVETAVIRLASQYWQRGSLPSDVAACAKLIGYRTRTLSSTGMRCAICSKPISVR